MANEDSTYPKPLSFRRAIKILNMREDPYDHLLKRGKTDARTISYLKGRASVRIVADLFGVSPKFVAEAVFYNPNFTMPDFSPGGPERPGDKTLWSKGKGAW